MKATGSCGGVTLPLHQLEVRLVAGNRCVCLSEPIAALGWAVLARGGATGGLKGLEQMT